MKRRNKCITFIILLACTPSYGQMEQYQFKRLVTGVNNQWHTVPLPDSIFGKVSNNLSDIRIYGLAGDKDTIEVPYLLRINSEKITSTAINFNIVNTRFSINISGKINLRSSNNLLKCISTGPINKSNLSG